MTKVYVIGLGMAGLAASVRLAGRGHQIMAFESATRAGGRCRSYHDAVIDGVIDNGNHVLLSGNDKAFDYLKQIGAEGSLTGPKLPLFPFYDLASRHAWQLRLNPGHFPFWIFSKKHRVPGSGFADYRDVIKLWRAPRGKTIADCVRPASPLYRNFWEPLILAILNLSPEKATARALKPVLSLLMRKGGKGFRLRFATESLEESFIKPALHYLAREEVSIRFNAPLKALKYEGDRVSGLLIGETEIRLDADEKVILAVPPSIARKFLSDLPIPESFSPIVNAHYRVDEVPSFPGGEDFIGIIGGISQWLFKRGKILSVTVSGARTEARLPAEELSEIIWHEIANICDMPPNPVPPCRIVKEKRATFEQNPENWEKRPEAQTAYTNLFLAGDWTETGLPATLEGAISSGYKAAEHIIATLPNKADPIG